MMPSTAIKIIFSSSLIFVYFVVKVSAHSASLRLCVKLLARYPPRVALWVDSPAGGRPPASEGNLHGTRHYSRPCAATVCRTASARRWVSRLATFPWCAHTNQIVITSPPTKQLVRQSKSSRKI